MSRCDDRADRVAEADGAEAASAHAWPSKQPRFSFDEPRLPSRGTGAHPLGHDHGMNAAERTLADLAARQRQVFTRAQALTAGLSPSALHRRIKDGLFVPYGPHALHFAGVTLDYRGRLLAGLLDLGPDALVSGRAAAALHGLDGFEEGPLQFLVPRSRRSRGTVGMVTSSPSIGALDRTTVDGLAATSGTRTVVELLGRTSERELGNALDSATRRGLTAPSVVRRRLEELGRQGRAGVAEFERVMESAGVQSWLERQFLHLLRSRSLPTPTTAASASPRRSSRRPRRLRLLSVTDHRRGRRPTWLPEPRRAAPPGTSSQRAAAARQGGVLLHDRGRRRGRPVRAVHACSRVCASPGRDVA